MLLNIQIHKDCCSSSAATAVKLTHFSNRPITRNTSAYLFFFFFHQYQRRFGCDIPHMVLCQWVLFLCMLFFYTSINVPAAIAGIQVRVENVVHSCLLELCWPACVFASLFSEPDPTLYSTLSSTHNINSSRESSSARTSHKTYISS